MKKKRQARGSGDAPRGADETRTDDRTKDGVEDRVSA